MQLKNMYKVLATTAILGQTLVGPVTSHAETVPSNTETYSQQQNSHENTLENASFINFAADVEKDFKDHPKEAKEWIERELKEQEKKMSSSDTQALQDFMKKDNKEITEYLIKNKGGLVDKNPLNSKIEKLDTIFEKKATKIDTSTKVYMKLSNMKIEDAAKVKDTILPRYDYTSTSPTNVTGSDAIVELTVPKGSRVVYGKTNDSGELIIERGTGFLVTDVKEVTDKGVVRTKIEAKLLSNKEMKERESKLNEVSKSLSDTMKMPVSLEFSNAETATSIEEAKTDITEANKALEDINKIVPTLNMSELFKKLVNKGVHIILQDSTILTEDKHGKEDYADGLYAYENKEIIVNLKRPTENAINQNALLHELGHAIDFEFFESKIEEDPKLKDIIDDEELAIFKLINIDYNLPLKKYYSQPMEYWAGVFSLFMTDNEKLKKLAPETYKYIEEKLKEVHL
ncbi:hypothetical protein BK708_04680 [Bacillus thuringiensis serovar yunnanensis]|nr:hypothetical protein BK708_04680 [Bacillus thuringiensis serovar yunnanensis]